MGKKRKKSIYKPYIIILSLIVLIYFGKIIYVSYKCKDLYEAADYLFTTKQCKELSLLRVQHMTLVYSDDNSAIIQVSGLNKIPPYETTEVEGEFKKNIFDSWELTKYSEINNRD
ncbi:MAG: hypothetical protein ACRC2K_00780 [Clostridium sp.]